MFNESEQSDGIASRTNYFLFVGENTCTATQRWYAHVECNTTDNFIQKDTQAVFEFYRSEQIKSLIEAGADKNSGNNKICIDAIHIVNCSTTTT